MSMLWILLLTLLSLTFGYTEQKPDEEALRLGTVSRGELAIHLGDTPEQVHEVLGMPVEERKRSIYTDSYPGLRVCYRDYSSLAEKYDWIKADGEDQYRVALIAILPPESPVDIVNPYTTADGIAVYAFASAMENTPNTYPVGPPDGSRVNYYSQIYYDGEYYTYEDWELKKQELMKSGKRDEYARATMEVVRIYYLFDNEKNQVKEINIGDEMYITMMR